MIRPNIIMAFFTGSQVYGSPNDKSDVDLVLRMSASEVQDLVGTGKFEVKGYLGKNNSLSLKTGNINLICIVTDATFNAWVQGTLHLAGKTKVSKEHAITHFESLGVQRASVSGDDYIDEDEIYPPANDEDEFPPLPKGNDVLF